MASPFEFQLTSLALPQAVAAGLCVTAIGFMWPLRRDAAAFWLILVLGGATLWSAAGALEFCAANMAGKILWTDVSYVGIVLGPVALFHFAYARTQGRARPPRGLSVAIMAIGALILLSALTNGAHRLHWPEILPVERDGLLFARYERGPGFWATVAYCYGFMFASSVMLAAHTVRLGSIFRQQAVIIILATLAPWVTSIAYVLRIGPRPELDHTPVGFAITGMLLTWAVARVRLFELVPVAADTLFLRIPDPVLVVDPAGRVVRANDAAFARFPPLRSAVGRPLAGVFAHLPGLAAPLAESASGPDGLQACVDGTWWTIASNSLAADGDQRRGRLVILRDVTAQKRSELALLDAKRELERTLARADALAREAVDANAAKSTFLAQVSHDLRTPLHAILGMTDTLRAGFLDETQRGEVDTIAAAGDSLLRLINDLLDLSRIEAGRIDLADEPFQIDDVLDPVADLLGPAARRKGLVFAHWVEPGLPGGLRGDIDRVRQILLNLAGNAVKFTERGGVTVAASREGRLLRVEVSDTGPGIAPAHLAAIFTPFNRGDPGLARHTEGSGLGLAIARRFAEAMGGSIRVESTLGQGTVFHLELPIVDDAATQPAFGRLAARMSGLRVAVEKADPVVREAIVRGLRGLGADAFAAPAGGDTPGADAVVIGASSGEDAVRRWSGAARRIVRVGAADVAAPDGCVAPRRRALALALAPETALPDAPFRAPGGPVRRVLLADDNLLGLRVSAAQLARCNCTVETVGGGLPALERLAAESYDLVVLDGQMPDLNGWEVALRLREDPRHALNARTPVVALTADLTPESHARWLKAGVDIVLGKPIRTPELFAAIERFRPRPPAA